MRAELLSKQADVIAAVTMEAVRATPAPFAHRIHAARGQTGQVQSAQRLRSVLHSDSNPSEIFLKHPHSVQDAYSLRCVPQVHGIVHDTVTFVKTIISKELNAATDNPMVGEHGVCVCVCAALCMGCLTCRLRSLSFRRCFRKTARL